MDNEHCKVYKLIYDGKIIPQKEEVDEIKFLTDEGTKELIGTSNFHPVGAIVFKKYLELKNKN